ncbi:DUF4023 domain-containing protein [Cohnella sp. CFH 77786]|nr:DUF4023 domain-containing protein [Cohnella sp. CFH 77786]
MESTEEFVKKLKDNEKKQEHNRRHGEGDPGKVLPNKRKGTMK